LRLRALNDYEAVIPLEDLRRYPILLASRQDGRALSVRERGPVWVVYPWSGYPELDTPVHRQRSVWQVAEITVE
jgi:hypothetical protein